MKKAMLILPVLSGILWGSSGIFVRNLSAFGMDGATVLASRALGAVIVMGLFLLLTDREKLRCRLRDLWVLIGGGLLGMLGLNLCYNAAINQLTLSLAAVLLSTSPVFVMFLAAIIFHEKITVRKIVCMLMAIVGCMFASGVLEHSFGASFSAGGIAIGVLAAAFYALYSIFSRLAMDRGYHTFTIIFYNLLAVTIVLIPFTKWTVIGAYMTEAPVGNSLFLLLHSVCTSVLPYVLYTVALNYVETGKASILAAGGEPIAAVVFGLLFYHEMPTVLTLLGLAITIVALALLVTPSKKEHQQISDRG